MTKIEKMNLINEYMRADMEEKIASGELKKRSLNPEIPEWTRWAAIFGSLGLVLGYIALNTL